MQKKKLMSNSDEVSIIVTIDAKCEMLGFREVPNKGCICMRICKSLSYWNTERTKTTFPYYVLALYYRGYFIILHFKERKMEGVNVLYLQSQDVEFITMSQRTQK